MEEIKYHPWALWPWARCKAATIDEYGKCRCDLRRGHEGHHVAERGMYDVVWSPENWMVHRPHERMEI